MLGRSSLRHKLLWMVHAPISEEGLTVFFGGPQDVQKLWLSGLRTGQRAKDMFPLRSRGGMKMLSAFRKFSASKKSIRGVRYEWSSRVVRRGRQTFAVFGSVAYDVSKQKFSDDGTGKLCVPIDGRYLAQFPDEGRCGVLGMYVMDFRGGRTKTDPCFVPCGWIETEELQQTDRQISENIAEEIMAGENVYFPAPPGWA